VVAFHAAAGDIHFKKWQCALQTAKLAAVEGSEMHANFQTDYWADCVDVKCIIRFVFRTANNCRDWPQKSQKLIKKNSFDKGGASTTASTAGGARRHTPLHSRRSKACPGKARSV
jgi:hypothetical protein